MLDACFWILDKRLNVESMRPVAGFWSLATGYKSLDAGMPGSWKAHKPDGWEPEKIEGKKIRG